MIFPHMPSAHSVIHISFKSTLSSYAVHYQYPPTPHMTPIHLSSPILTLFAPFHSLALSDHLSPPLLNQVSLIYQTPSSLSSPLSVFLIHSPLWRRVPPSRAEQNGSERRCCCGRWLTARGCEQAKNPSRVRKEREDDTPFRRSARAFAQPEMGTCACVQTPSAVLAGAGASGHVATFTKPDEPGRRHAHRRDTAIFNVPV